MGDASGGVGREHLEELQQGDLDPQEFLGDNQGTYRPLMLHRAALGVFRWRHRVHHPINLLSSQLAQKCPTHECECDNNCRNDKPNVTVSYDALASRVKSHGCSIAWYWQHRQRDND